MSYFCISDSAVQPFSARYGAMALVPLRWVRSPTGRTGLVGSERRVEGLACRHAQPTMVVAGWGGAACFPQAGHAVGIETFELLMDAEGLFMGEQRAATLAGQVRVGLSSTGNLVSGLGVLGQLGDSTDLGLAEVVARWILAEVDSDAAMLGRYAGGCSLLLVVLKALDRQVEGSAEAATSPEAGEDFVVKNPPAKN